jgi:hypothetical protein
MAKKKPELSNELPQSAEENLRDKAGRPTLYTEELAERICLLVATTTISIKKLCKLHPDLPNQDTIFQWRYRYSTFSDQWNKAMVFRAQLLAEEIIEISDDTHGDWLTDDEGKEVFNNEHFLRTKLRCENRRWMAPRLCKALYGDKSETTVNINKHEDALAALK